MRPPARGAASLLACLALTACGRTTAPRDVVLITLDTTRADHLGCYGATGAETPTLDGIAREGVLFEQAVSAVPVTLPSHSTMFTGLEPRHHGVRYNGLYVLPESMTTLAERLRDAGFATAGFPASFSVAKIFGVSQGFETYDDLFSGPEARTLDSGAERRAGEIVDRALGWWTSHTGRRRFVWLHINDAHSPYEPPFPYSARYESRPYDGEIAYMDHELARFVGALKGDGSWSGALVIVAGDHGEGLYEHGERRHSVLVYDSTLHVPFLVKAPGPTRPRRVPEPVGLVDLTPTVLDYLRLPATGLDGRSLRGAIEGGTLPRRSILFESLAGEISYGWSPLYGARRGPLKYFEGGRPELYDVGSDPGETRNLAALGDARMDALKDDVAQYRAGAADSASSATVDAEALARLSALGYVGGSTGSSHGGASRHPPDVIALESEALDALEAVLARKDEAARASLDFVLERDPTNKFALVHRAIVAGQLGDAARAIELGRIAVDLYPDSIEAWDVVGRTLARQGKTDEAARWYADALAKAGEKPLLRYHRFVTLMEAGRREPAGDDLAKLEAEAPNQTTTVLARAWSRAAAGDTRGSLDALESAVDRGLRDLAVVEGRPEFAAVRADPRYDALKRRLPDRGAHPAGGASKDSPR